MASTWSERAPLCTNQKARCSTAHEYVNRKTRIKRAKNRMQLRITKIVRVKKSHVRARLWYIGLINMYEVVLLSFYCWRFIVLKNKLQFHITKILHGYQRQANLFVAIAVRTDLPKMLLPMRLRNRNKWMTYHFPTEFICQGIHLSSYFSLRI